MAGKIERNTDVKEIRRAGGAFDAGGDITSTGALIGAEVKTTGADTLRHVAFTGTGATNAGLYPVAGSTPQLRLKAASATNSTSNVSDGRFVGKQFYVYDADTSNNAAVAIDRTAGVQYGPAGSGLTLTTGTMSGIATGNLRTMWAAASWTNAQVVALGAVATGTISVCTLPAKTLVHRCFIVINTAATQATTLTVSCGRVGATYIDWVVASNAKAAANTVYGDQPDGTESGTGLYRAGLTNANDGHWSDDLPSWTGTTVVNALFTAGTTLDTVLTSTGTVYILYSILP